MYRQLFLDNNSIYEKYTVLFQKSRIANCFSMIIIATRYKFSFSTYSKAVLLAAVLLLYIIRLVEKRALKLDYVQNTKNWWLRWLRFGIDERGIRRKNIQV